MTNMLSNDERDKLIVSLWNEGLTGKEIAEALGVTKGLIMGKVYRMRKAGIPLETRDPNNERSRSGSIKKLIIDVKEIEISGRKGKKVSINDAQLTFTLFDDNEEKQKGVDILKLTSRSCRYVLETPTLYRSAIYCGKDKDRRQYCEEHYKLCYSPTKLKSLF